MTRQITASEIEYLRIMLSRETDSNKAIKMQQELIELEREYDIQFKQRVRGNKDDGKRMA